ncbi:MAG TPA: hypothetical protein VJA21_01040 [Verrucomicrobiae bacterium]
MQTKTYLRLILLASFVLPATLSVAATRMGAAFTYQGRLDDGGAPAKGIYDLRFTVYDLPSGGTAVGASITNNSVTVSEGLFAVKLDFGADVFAGDARWLEIGVKTEGGRAFTVLSPRQLLTPSPYALYAPSAGTARGVVAGAITGSDIQAGSITSLQVADGTIAQADLSPDLASNTFWRLGGNSATASGVNFLGTTDNEALEFKANGRRGFQLGYASHVYGDPIVTAVDRTMNLIGGYTSNSVSAGVIGATIGGGGYLYDALLAGSDTSHPNRVTGDFGTVGGGFDNVAGTGGTVPGGRDNSATGEGSFAAGRNAAAAFAGSFVWGDGTASTGSGGANRFVARATGGVRFYTDESIYSDTPKGISLNAQDRPMITREWDKFSSTAPDDKAGLGRWGLFMEPMHLVAGIPDADAGDRAFAVWAYQTNGNHRSLFWIRNIDGQAWFSNNVSVATLTIRGGADLAEPFAMSSTDVPAGTLVVIDPAQPGRLKLSTRAYDRTVAGIVSGANGIQPGISMVQESALEAGRNVALSGRAYALVDATTAPVEPGDLLTTSDTPGHAMKVKDHARGQGAIVGKAMTALSEGRGLVLVLVTLQ